MEETWKPVVGWEDLYDISTLGRVRRMFSKGYHYLKHGQNDKGYAQVVLSRGGKRCPRTVHTLVAEAFIGPRPPRMDVSHEDNDRMNPKLENLQYKTRRDNINHSIATFNSRRGKNSPVAKLKEEDIPVIRRRLEAGDTCRTIAADYGVHFVTISQVATGKAWSWLK